MKHKVFIVLVLSILVFSPVYGSSWFSLKDYGVKGERSENVTNSVQQVIDKCNKMGGGTVFFPPGDYLCGTLVLKSNVTLWLEAGATIWGSRNKEDYRQSKQISETAGFENLPSSPVLIYADRVQNVSIRGKGTIDVQAEREYLPLKHLDPFIEEETVIARKSGVEMKQFYKVEPSTCMLFIKNSSNILIEDVTFWESSGWTLHLQWSEKINIRGCRIYSSLVSGVNADGIDIDGCKDVCISDCIIKTGDDAIVLKTTLKEGHAESCENITVSNCLLTSTSSALKIGTETYADFRYISFANCIIRDTNRGLSIVVRDGATVEYVSFSNIQLETKRKHFNWWGNGDPIWIVVKKRNENSKIGKIDNVRFDGISGSGEGTSIIEGFSSDYPLGKIVLNNVDLKMFPECLPDKRATDGFKFSNVEYLSLSNMNITWDGKKSEPNWRYTYYLEKIKKLELHRVRGRILNDICKTLIYTREIDDSIYD
ncbi:glycosyl hydrolase family 28 protein [uncultured Parabacteroides sp.]|uniref:glycoside hydrolase family 28 protein n=1 Tax=uncultured Parabacteroides sp. TaxID=512312 RepID=UPI0025D80E65|nr:glycosyl hydrolase family 28 protein [uncultured Parabacteroides sp.]